MADKKSFASYVAEVKTEYKYVLKFAVQEMTDPMIDKLEAGLAKYGLKSASAFRKTPIQESPLDFPNVKNTPVFICDLVLEYPSSLDFLRVYICNCLGISPALLAVYSENDPRQIETDLYNERNSPEFKKGYHTVLGSDHEGPIGQDTYGDKYNISFLKELEKVRKERKTVTVENPLSPAPTEDHSMFPKDYDGFNDDKHVDKHSLSVFGRLKRPALIKVGKL